jgi:hypothetical protein
MIGSQKNVFWQAFILSAAIFIIGIFLGFILENWRSNQINALFQQSELDFLDVRLQSDIYSSSLDCTNAIQENTAFADRIYGEAQLLDRYESASRISDSIIIQHKKYDLLRAMLWSNSIKIKQTCKADFHDIVYLYKYNDKTIETQAKQAVFSRLLLEVKQDYGSNIILIPLSGDNNLTSIKLLMDKYNITESELPVILIDEKAKITQVSTKEEIAQFLGTSAIKLN